MFLLIAVMLLSNMMISAIESNSAKKEYTFNEVLSFSQQNDIEFTKPNGFKDLTLTEYYHFKPNSSYASNAKYISRGNSYRGTTGFPYISALQSESEDCLILYPFFDFAIPRFEGQIQEDISYAAEDELMDIRPFVKIIDKKDGTYISNADKAVIYEFKTPKKHFGLYDNFVGIYLRKQGQGCLLLKIGLTEEGLKHKDKHIKMLLNSIKYGDKILNPDDKMPTDDEFRFSPPTLLRPETKEGYIQ